jgi:dihydrofolate synthase/folylpolyglutamate synthase
LGGRLDSTNVVTPLLSIITNIGYDHQQFLGDTLPEIAGEKAGIIKAGVPVLIGESQDEVRHVFEQKADQLRSPLFYANQLIRVEKAGQYPGGQIFTVKRNDGFRMDALRLGASGAYQQKNLATVLAALDRLKSTFRVGEKDLRKGLEDLRNLTRFLGRWQMLRENPTVVADSAHNLDGVRYAMDQLADYDYRRLHMVWGMVADKDQAPILALLPKGAVYYFVKPDIPRGLDAEELREKARVAGLRGESYGSVKEGVTVALEQADEKDLVFVGGSIFVVAEVV